jgi:hypothetical protein
MPRSVILKGLCLLIALAVMLGASSLRYPGPAPYITGLAQAADDGAHGHGHSHDNDEDITEADPPAAHGHEHQEHSHVLLGLAPPVAFLAAIRTGEPLRPCGECRGTSDPPYRLDRPPCAVSVA